MVVWLGVEYSVLFFPLLLLPPLPLLLLLLLLLLHEAHPLLHLEGLSFCGYVLILSWGMSKCITTAR